MKILVTGNLGYIGTILSEELLNRNYYFEGLDCGFYRDDILETPIEPIKQYICDIRKIDEKILSDIDVIIHLAGLSNDPLGQFEAELTNEINFKSTIDLAKKAKNKNVKRFIYSSSQSMYGISQTSDELDEYNSTKNPLTAYGITKWNSEQEIMRLSDDNFIVTALRFSTVFGGSPRLRCDIVFNNLLANAYTKKKIIIKSDGTPWRPILHVRDACNSIIACIEAPEKLVNKKAYNVGINNGNYTVNELANAVKRIIPDSEIIYTNEHGNDSRTYKVSFKRILSELKDFYKPKYDLDLGGLELLNYFKKVNFKIKDLDEEKTIRLNRLKKLRKENIIDTKFYFNENL